MKKYLYLSTLTLFVSLNGCDSGEPVEQNYTVPSWTLYQRALQSGQSVSEANTLLVPKDYPYNINTTVNGEPATQMGIAWFTNANVTGSIVQVVEGEGYDNSLFANARDIPAVSSVVDSVNYISIGRDDRNNNQALIEATGFASGEKRSYKQ